MTLNKYLKMFFTFAVGLFAFVVQAPGEFSVDEAKNIRIIADKFVPTTAQQTTFLTSAKGLVASFSKATSVQRAFVIESIEDARYGGTMAPIQNDLDALLVTAKATPAGIASNTPTDPNSAANPVNVAVASYLDRISSLSTYLASYYLKQVTEASKVQAFSLIQALFDDRADSFADERQRLVQVLSDAKVAFFREDVARKTQIDTFISQLSVPIPFDVQLTAQKKLYSNFTPLTADQKTRVLRHFAEMVALLPTVTDVVQNNDFRDLLQFVGVAFFQDDPNSRSQVSGMLSKVQVLDPIFAKTYAEIISTLKASSVTIAPGDLGGFIDKVKTLVTLRYGKKPDDVINMAANATALQDFLSSLISLPPFSSQVPQLTVWLGQVKADNITQVQQAFGDRVSAFATADFMMQTNDPAKRATFMTSLTQLMTDRYGSSDADKTPDAITLNKRKFRQLLAWVAQISWFSAELPIINSYITQIDADPAGGPVAGVPPVVPVVPGPPTGNFMVTFGDDISNQITKLEQSMPAITSDNQREMFMLSLYEVVQRRSGASTADVNRMRTLANNARTNTALGSAYASYCSFVLTGIDGNLDTSQRNQVYIDMAVRIAEMTLVADVIQQKMVDFIELLVENSSMLSSAQITALADAVRKIVVRKNFSDGRISDLTDLYTELSKNISGTTSPLPGSNSQTPPSVNDQREATRNLLTARQNSWR